MRRAVLGGLAISLMLAGGGVVSAEGLKPRFDIEGTAGAGLTVDTNFHNSTAHLSGGLTFFKLDDDAHIGLLGLGVAVDFYDFANHSAEMRDLARKNILGFVTSVPLTLIPIRVGPLAYHVSLSKVDTLGVRRGRLHMITYDILGHIRMHKKL